MNDELQILRGLILSNIGTDSKFDKSVLTDSFLEQFAKALCQYEIDAKPLYARIYSLELANPEKCISKLDIIYLTFVNEIAESFVVGNNENSICISLLVNNQNAVFHKRVLFYKNLEKVIKKVERQRMKDALPTAWEALTYKIPENTLENVIKKQSREKLKQQFKKWDEELKNIEVPLCLEDSGIKYFFNPSKVSPLINKTEAKVSPLINKTEAKASIITTYKYYALVACILFLVSFWSFINTYWNDLNSNGAVELSSFEKQKKQILDEIKQIESRGLVDVASNQKSVEILSTKGVGYINKTQKLKIVIKDPQPRITSIIQAIEQYQKLLETKFAPNSISDQNKIFKLLENKIDSLKIELSSLKAMQNTYVFDGKMVTLHTSGNAKIHILFSEDIYYLKKEDSIYPLVQTTQTKKLEKLKDSEKQEALSKILFDNGF